ncbi:MAG: hypothetical protein ACOX88_02600 [Christensenellales bacterium]|jgi:hypothetical protein
MKKFVTFLCVVALLTSLSLTALAAPAFVPATSTNKDYTLSDEDNEPTVTTPVYGYVGPDAIITDPDPEDPDAQPEVEVIATDMEISVPVKLMWAAFASGGGTIVSPSYTIENKSPFAVDVELTSFTSDTDVPDPVKDAGIVLNLSSLAAAATNVPGTSGLTVPVVVGTLTAATGAAPSKAFSIGGTYTGSFAAVYQPTYQMVLTFSIN